jgi:hypothetical protein
MLAYFAVEYLQSRFIVHSACMHLIFEAFTEGIAVCLDKYVGGRPSVKIRFGESKF